jgi:hypothetical protein
VGILFTVSLGDVDLFLYAVSLCGNTLMVKNCMAP